MNKKQIWELVAGLIFLMAGIWFLNQNIPDNTEKREATVTAVMEDTKIEETAEISGLTRAINWLHEQEIPFWIYILIFAVLVLGIKVRSIIHDVRLLRKKQESEQKR